jgi:hypothetical protein
MLTENLCSLRPMPLSFVTPRQSVESIVAHALLRAASALVPTPGLPVGRGYGETSGASSNNISPLKCLWHQKLSDIGRFRLPTGFFMALP